MNASPNLSSTITVNNDVAAPTLNRVAYHAAFGQWHTPPRGSLPPGASNTLVIDSDPTKNQGSQGLVSYRRAPGVTLKIFFQCTESANVVSVIPTEDFTVTYNKTGTPLVAVVNVLANENEKPDDDHANFDSAPQ